MQASSTAPQTGDLIHHRGPFSNLAEASAAAHRIVMDMTLEGRCSALEVIGQFVVPPLDLPQRRDFQTMHFDFGLPLDIGRPVDSHAAPALYMPAELAPSAALTRFVALLDQRSWAPRDVLLARFVAYGASHGAWDHTVGYIEGSLALLVEAATGDAPVLPSVSVDPDFLSGHEFAELDAESVFADRGRRGVRRPAELRQVVFGHRALARAGQAEIRNVVLRALGAG